MIMYGGWLFGNKSEKKILSSLGVKGPMKWGNTGHGPFGGGTFARCICNAATLEVLDTRYSRMWAALAESDKETFFYYPPSKRFSELTEEDLKEFKDYL